VRGRILLIGSMLAAIVVAVLTTVALLLVEPVLSKAPAIQTGGLAGGPVVAPYALWLYDPRRRTDEERHARASDRRASSEAPCCVRAAAIVFRMVACLLVLCSSTCTCPRAARPTEMYGTACGQ